MADIKLNPANPTSLISQFESGERKRIPMTLPKAKLSAPDIPGYHLHWFADRQGGARIMQALQAGYEFVNGDEVGPQDFGLGNDVSKNGNTDLGSRISIVGGKGDTGGAERLYLMKIKQEWWEEDQKGLTDRNDQIMNTIKRTGIKADGESATDASRRYVKTADLRTNNRKSIS